MLQPLAVVPTLDAVADGQPLDGLPGRAIVALYERAAVVEARLRARLLALSPDADRTPIAEADRVLNIDEAAQMLGMSKDYLYRHWPKLGIAYKDADGHVKFPASKVQRYIRARVSR